MCSEKFRICESSEADDLRKIATFLWMMYTNLRFDNNKAMFSADLYYHKTCYLKYYKLYSHSITNKFNDTAKTSNIETNDIVTAKLIIKSDIREIKRVINHTSGISLS